MPTALEVAQEMTLSNEAEKALAYNVHPQTRTLAFHRMFKAPVRELLDGPPDDKFSHMDNQRVAFRAGFILSECLELIEKGLGLKVQLKIYAPSGNNYYSDRNDHTLTSALESALDEGGKRNIIEVVDALGDLNVVVNGFAIELGIDMKEIDREIYASNLTKLDDNGEAIIADGSDPRYPAGKIIKGPNFIEPQIKTIITYTF